MVAHNSINHLKIAFIATYPPRQCGIATFTADLYNSLKALYSEDEHNDCRDYLQVIALNNDSKEYNYGDEVSFKIRAPYQGDYRQATDFINLSPVDVVCLQHEFGIFGGEDGNNIFPLLGALKKPVVTTLHTVLEKPTAGQLKTLRWICNRSTLVVVLAEKAVTLLQDVYQVPKEKIVKIHHGTPDLPFLDTSYYKEQFQAEGKKVLLTFGLLSPNKGIEHVIAALPEVVEEFPDTLYFVLGATHPEVKRQHGEEYRHSLEKMVRDKGLLDNVVFYNQYVTMERLLQFIMAADIYINPYVNKEQISSGTLAYALACGKAIVSTPYWYAEELLADERGFLVPFRNNKAIGGALIKLLNNETLRDRMRKSSYEYGRQMIWSKVAKAYTRTFEQALLNYRSSKSRLIRKENVGEGAIMPDVKLTHMRILTDDTGLFQHAAFSIPDRFHGYCIDDNARALIVTIMNWCLFKDESIIPLTHVYLGFLNYAFDSQSQRVRNFMSYNRQWMEEVGSEDSHGRTIWALGYTIAYPPSDAILGLASRLFKQAVGVTPSFTSPRAWAHTIMGSLYYLKRFRGDTEAQSVIEKLSQKLLGLFQATAREEWFWCEEVVAYDNARLPQALIAAGDYLADEKMLDTGLKALNWLITIQTDPVKKHLSLVGNNGWYRYGGEKARFDQQPLEVAALIDACYQAYLATQETHWHKYMDWAFNWFFGNNDIGQVVYNFTTGGCYDGLQPGGVNQNQGGESIVSFLLALHQMQQPASYIAVEDVEKSTGQGLSTAPDPKEHLAGRA